MAKARITLTLKRHEARTLLLGIEDYLHELRRIDAGTEEWMRTLSDIAATLRQAGID